MGRPAGHPRTLSWPPPPGALGDTRTRVLLAVQTIPHPTIPKIVDVVGINRASVHRHLRELRVDGLIWWEDGKAGTLYALVQPVAAP